MSRTSQNFESETQSMEATQIIDMIACIESRQQSAQLHSNRNIRSISSCSSSSSRRRNQSLRKLLNDVKTKQMDTQELMQQIPRNSNSQIPDF